MELTSCHVSRFEFEVDCGGGVGDGINEVEDDLVMILVELMTMSSALVWTMLE